MGQLLRHPAILFVVLLVVLAIAVAIGSLLLRRFRPIPADSRDDFNIIQGATLTLLALLIGFTLSMAVGRYDQRKNLEEEEANAIGTEYLRAQFLDAQAAERARTLLASYLAQRIEYYQTRDDDALRQIAAATARTQDEMWAVVRDAGLKTPTPITALTVSGMNDVINSQGYTEAAWLNRIPVAAWGLMVGIAFFSSLMQGYGARNARPQLGLLLILPLTVAVSLALIADIDSPRGGLIRVKPQNLLNLQGSLGR
ncbi:MULTISPECIES: hypothetical protein [unclassified Cupriavidus]|uniref:bestrophin-like domain n=1 Tax=unclassified Cupriavidus TaxID=2640874 RepID=UPI0028B4114E|nr:hypothetical protein [Cupriavidus sp. SZY C1]MDT6963143.1 hypothetical protein [Cupriavidus sp. SZY C1]